MSSVPAEDDNIDVRDWGKAKIFIHEARNLQLVKKGQAPFVSIKVGRAKVKTAVQKEPQNPKWEEGFRLPAHPGAPPRVRLWHPASIGPDTSLGIVDLSFAKCIQNQKITAWYPVMLGAEQAGELHVSIVAEDFGLPDLVPPDSKKVWDGMQNELAVLKEDKANVAIPFDGVRNAALRDSCIVRLYWLGFIAWYKTPQSPTPLGYLLAPDQLSTGGALLRIRSVEITFDSDAKVKEWVAAIRDAQVKGRYQFKNGLVVNKHLLCNEAMSVPSPDLPAGVQAVDPSGYPYYPTVDSVGITGNLHKKFCNRIVFTRDYEDSEDFPETKLVTQFKTRDTIFGRVFLPMPPRDIPIYQDRGKVVYAPEGHLFLWYSVFVNGVRWKPAAPINGRADAFTCSQADTRQNSWTYFHLIPVSNDTNKRPDDSFARNTQNEEAAWAQLWKGKPGGSYQIRFEMDISIGSQKTRYGIASGEFAFEHDGGEVKELPRAKVPSEHDVVINRMNEKKDGHALLVVRAVNKNEFTSIITTPKLKCYCYWATGPVFYIFANADGSDWITWRTTDQLQIKKFDLVLEALKKDTAGIVPLDRVGVACEATPHALRQRWTDSMGEIAQFFNVKPAAALPPSPRAGAVPPAPRAAGLPPSPRPVAPPPSVSPRPAPVAPAASPRKFCANCGVAAQPGNFCASCGAKYP